MKKAISAVLALLCCLLVTGCSQKQADIDLNRLMGDIESAYGNNWLANSQMSDTVFYDEYGLDKSMVEEYVGRMPMTSDHPDRVLLIRAAKGKGEQVEKALNDRIKELIRNGVEDPSFVAKLNAAKVVREGDYVSLLMVGAYDTQSGGDEQAALQFAKDQVKIAEDVFKNAFK